MAQWLPNLFAYASRAGLVSLRTVTSASVRTDLLPMRTMTPPLRYVSSVGLKLPVMTLGRCLYPGERMRVELEEPRHSVMMQKVLRDAKPHYIGVTMRREEADLDQPVLETSWRGYNVGTMAEVCRARVELPGGPGSRVTSVQLLGVGRFRVTDTERSLIGTWDATIDMLPEEANIASDAATVAEGEDKKEKKDEKGKDYEENSDNIINVGGSGSAGKSSATDAVDKGPSPFNAGPPTASAAEAVEDDKDAATVEEEVAKAVKMTRNQHAIAAQLVYEYAKLTLVGEPDRLSEFQESLLKHALRPPNEFSWWVTMQLKPKLMANDEGRRRAQELLEMDNVCDRLTAANFILSERVDYMREISGGC